MGLILLWKKLRNFKKRSVEGVSGKSLVGWSNLLTVENRGVALTSSNDSLY